MRSRPNAERFTNAWAIDTESGRTGIVTCLRCGCALILDAEVNVLKLHAEWHREEKEKPDA